ncbi:MAG: NADH-quinone oxidoreductase subunit L [Planctomycetota bacterium]|nr:NADH-quinone oxidoreductase subunit L [Planctomycetota bacterium]
MTPVQAHILDLLAAATLIPLASALLLLFAGKRWLGRLSGWVATLAMAGSCGCALAALSAWQDNLPATIVFEIPWIPVPGQAAGYLNLGMLVDHLTVAMTAMVTLIATLVHLYSIGYMQGDKRFERFFAYLSLFTFAMLGIVVSASLTQLFVFWELVGLTSYLLIGFWFERPGPRLACKKAFVMNRIGDAGFLAGLAILYCKLGGNLLLPAAGDAQTPSGVPIETIYQTLTAILADENASILSPPAWLTFAGIALFCGAIGKSAQFPLHTWLPDAMEGPTPVSSIVHSATMVAAGVYLTARLLPILTPGVHLFIATIGLVTLVIGACMALVMTDIKRVLAYSTLSQLGYMVLGLGAGAYNFALLHLVAHAFFKCCLFQCAGSVIHAAGGKQDLRSFGGLWRKMPATMACFAVCTLAIAGASVMGVGLSGHYSKDGLIACMHNYGLALDEAFNPGGTTFPFAHIFYWAPVAVAYVTAFYMARAFTLTFLGSPREPHLIEHAHEAPLTMLVPQGALALLAVVATPWGMAFWGDRINASAMIVPWVQGGTEEQVGETAVEFTHHAVGFAWLVGIAGGVALYAAGTKNAARLAKLPGVRLLHTWFLNKFYFDGLYDGFVVGLAKAVAGLAWILDRAVIDAAVDALAKRVREGAASISPFDPDPSGSPINSVAFAAQAADQALRPTHSGRIRLYVLLAFGSAALILMAVLILVFAARAAGHAA